MTNIQQEVINGNINPYELLDLWNEKPLDQSDIESLGWVIKNFHSNGTPMLMGGQEIYFYFTDQNDHEIQFRYNIKENYCIIMYTNKEGWVDYEQYLSLFQGTIKNKSELVKLMQQLNIK